MKRIRIVTKMLASTSAREVAKGLSTHLGYRVWRGLSPKPLQRNLVYGDQVNKTAQYKWFEEREIPALTFTEKQSEAKEWAEEGLTVICRRLTRASEGKGIVVAETPEQVVLAPVYTQYKKKKREFRVHVFQDKVVQILEKKRKIGYPEVDSKIRNHKNGWIFCSEGVLAPPGLSELALSASKVSSSDFKGVDIGYNEKKNELFVIEVNSAPGIQGTNINRYVNTILSC